MCCEIWGNAEQLLELFCVDCSKNGAIDFIGLAEIGGELLQFPEYGCSFYDVAVALMRQHKLSPLVFWSRIKRHCAALMNADKSTLEALGLKLKGDKPTAYEVTAAVAAAIAARGGGSSEYAAKYAAIIAAGKQKGRG